MTASDRRSHTRHAAALLPAKLRFNHPLRLLDLSLGGARVETREWLAPSRRYCFRVGTDPELHLSGQVIRCALVRVEDDSDGGRALYEAGIRFEGLPETAGSQLDALLATLPGAVEELGRAASWLP